jgi:lipoate-protein ligase A
MILWCDGAYDAAENMRRDHALLAAAEAGAPPVLRLFQFAPPGITLGHNQDPARELDLARCTADRVGWAIRPTGGRAIFHAEEWTYSVAAPRDDPEWGGSPADTYARASELILRALVRLGVPADLVARHASGRAGRSDGHAAPGPGGRGGVAAPCFASTARHEVVVRGRKLVGSAQRRTGRAWLQQGSILLGDGHLRLADYLAIAPDTRESVRETLRRASGSAGPWLGSQPPLTRFADAIAAELGGHSSRLEGASGGVLLTVSGSGSYTAAVV